MDGQLADRAIKCALNQSWQEAIELNQELLLIDQDNIEAFNRLAFAYLKSGKLALAKSTYKKVLKLDKYNPIAVKNLKWLTHVTQEDINQNASVTPMPTIFLEEPGKTKIVTLVNPTSTKVLCNIMTSQKVFFHAKKFSIEVRDNKDTYIGALPDDLSHRLLRFISAGNIYDVYIKNIAKNNVVVFIRELKRCKKYLQIPSFSLINHVVKRSDAKNSNEKLNSNNKEDQGEGDTEADSEAESSSD